MTSNLPALPAYAPIVLAPGDIEADPLDQQGYEAIVGHFAGKRHAEWLLLTRLLRATGLREAEVLRLQPELIERHGPETYLMVKRGKQIKHGEQVPKWERVPVRADIAMMLDSHIAAAGIPRGWKVFQRKARAYQKAFRLASIAATGSAHHPHELRGLYCVDLLDQGRPLAIVSKMLGHSSEATTLKYYNRLTARQRGQINQHVRA